MQQNADKSSTFLAGVLNMSPNVNIIPCNVCFVHSTTAKSASVNCSCTFPQVSLRELIFFSVSRTVLIKRSVYLILPQTRNNLANTSYDQSVCQVMSWTCYDTNPWIMRQIKHLEVTFFSLNLNHAFYLSRFSDFFLYLFQSTIKIFTGCGLIFLHSILRVLYSCVLLYSYNFLSEVICCRVSVAYFLILSS